MGREGVTAEYGKWHHSVQKGVAVVGSILGIEDS